MKPSIVYVILAFALAACADTVPPAGSSGAVVDRADRLERLLRTLADDSMAGRRAGTPGARSAAEFLAADLARHGVEPAGGDGYFQTVPMALPAGPSDPVQTDRQVPLPTDDVNVIGLVRGVDPVLRDEFVVLGAHFDHVGVGAAVAGDSIYNGADDDGSGTVAVLEIARALAADPPARSVLILLSTAEEQGLVGTRHYLDHPVVPLGQTVADFQIEMIGRPDSLAGGPGRGWLTGYERTTMGDALSDAGSPIVPDPRPEMRFFFRSDNLPFAERGIPAHTLSSYNMHADYHRPSDEVDAVDFQHMTALVDAAEQAVRFLASGARPDWKPGGRDGLSGH